MIRSILAILAGYATNVVLVVIATIIAVKVVLHAPDLKSAMTLKPTPVYLAVNLTYSVLFAILGGFVTAVVARRAPMAHALALGVFIVAMGIVSFFQESDSAQPKWYAITVMILGSLGAVGGGFLQCLRAAP